jgi:hypothetical protein
MTAKLAGAASSAVDVKPLPHLRPARFDDYDQVMRLETVLRPAGPSPADWRRLWCDSPLWPRLGQAWPIGWVLETRMGEIVGSFGNIPLMYHFHGEPFVAATGRGWVVEPEYRGFALWLLAERYDQPWVDLFVDTTVGPAALEAQTEFSNRVPVGDWETIPYFVTEYRAFAKRALEKLKIPLDRVLAPPAGATLRLKDAIFGKKLPAAHPSFIIETADRFDSRFDAFWNELLRKNADRLMAVRDSATLSWHFFQAMQRDRVWILTASRNRQLRAYAIFMRQDRPGTPRRMRLMDYQSIESAVNLLPQLLGAALQRCVAEGICVLDKPGLGLGKMGAFDELAPYRRKQSWPLFYRAVDPALAAELHQPQAWQPSEYDGDGTFE